MEESGWSRGDALWRDSARAEEGDEIGGDTTSGGYSSVSSVFCHGDARAV